MSLHLHMVGNAHLDPAWMWQWGEGVEAFLATVRSALDRIRETDQFVFTCSSAAHYRWIQRLEPELFEEVRRRVREGRWAVVGGWWVQADCNLPSGEGFIRQALLAQRYFHRHFGMTARTGYSPDAFGHNLGLPQLLRESGMDRYVFCRPDPTELALRSPLFRWIGAAGAEVLAYRVPLHYNMYETSVPKKVRDIEEAFDRPSDLADRPLHDYGEQWALFYGVGNHGGGPTREHIAQILELDARQDAPALLFSDPDRFFDSVSEERLQRLPEHRDDLQIDAPGCYSAHSQVKALNRRCEFALLSAERFSAMAALLLDTPYDVESLSRAWEDVCFNHFHDILCGVAIREALADAIDMYGRARAIAIEAQRFARIRIARAVDTRGPGQTVVVFNPHAFELHAPVRFELWHDIDKSLWTEPVDITVTDDDGRELATQGGWTSGKIGRDRVAATFPAHLPALGWRCYRVHYGRPCTIATPPAPGPGVLQNEFLRVEVSDRTGALRSIVRRDTGEELLSGEAGAAIAMDDATDTWGHGVERFDGVIGRFSAAEVRTVEHGPVRSTIRSVSRWRESWVQQEIRLYQNRRDIEVDVTVFWAEHHVMLKLDFPTTLTSATARYQSAYCVTPKPCDGRERPGGSWAVIAGTGGSFGIANDSKHSYSASLDASGRAALQLTVLRSPSFATHDPHPFDPDEDLDYLDQGMQRFGYVIVPFDAEDERMTRTAMVVDTPIEPVLESAHAGRGLGRSYSGAAITPETVLLTTLKRSEDDDAWIVRLFESSGHECEAEIELPLLHASWRSTFRPHEVQTWRIAEGVARRVLATEFDAPDRVDRPSG